MKKIITAVTILMALLLSACAFADGMGVQVIGGPDTTTEPVALDDIQIESSVDIDGYATLLPTSFEYVNIIYYYKAGQRNASYHFDDFAATTWSGNDAEYALLRMHITNLNTKPKNFLENAEVKVVFDDKYEYGGWFRQYNYDNGTSGRHAFENAQNRNYVINPADVFVIGPMYTGHYAFGCTLPNAVVESKLPLRMVIMLDGNEITFNIRK